MSLRYLVFLFIIFSPFEKITTNFKINLFLLKDILNYALHNFAVFYQTST